MKLAAMEAMWETEPAPASFTVFGIPDVKEHVTHDAIKVPWALGLIATRSIDQQIPGINELVAKAKVRVEHGMKAYGLLEKLKQDRNNTALRAEFDKYKADLGYGLLLLRQVSDPAKATPAQVEAAAESTIPNVPVLFWTFRFMVGLGFYFIALFALAFYLSARHQFDRYRYFLLAAAFSLPLPWIAAELGWIVAEYGRQPWAIEGVLPTFLGVSTTKVSNVVLSLVGFIVFYTGLAVVDAYLMTRMVRRGPDQLGYWPPDAQQGD